MALFEKNSWVWIVDEEERYLPAKVLTPFAKGTPITVMTEDGDERELSAAESAQVSECNEEALSSKIEDLVNISDLNEMSILHCLRNRFKEDKIYTNISSILISVNPFKMLPLYTPQILDNYRQGYRGKSPHVFGIAYNAFHDMLNEARDQSVVISGESGAGKSEATKLILQFLTDVSSRSTTESTASSTGASKQNLEQQILAANPILEALGNAKTLRNNNSSRFGKLITVNFDKNGQIIGGNIINYLLEKSRVVQQTQGERNYHIFYQLIAAANTNQNLQDDLKLQDAELFAYTGQSGVIRVDGISDEKDYGDVENSLNILQFTAEEKNMIFRIIAGVLHFGNVKFKVEQRANQEDSCSISNTEVLTTAAGMWNIDPKNIEKFLTSRHIGTSRELILVSYNITQALDARDAMVKKVYAELFQYVVDRINVALSAGGAKRHKFIGVLDIFGFESFAVNSFEQLCINFCNEKLQFHFNEHIFKMEQALYAQEGIIIPGSSFVDNKPTLDLLEAKGTGVFSMVDEEISVPKGSDEGVLSKILQKHGDGKHPNMIRPKTKDCQDFLKNFGILHYAGPVFYNISNFLEKNKDQLHPDIAAVLRESKAPLLAKLFPPDNAAAGGAKGGTKKLTLGGQFKNQLNDLINTLNATFPHFVRCMKSNDKKQGNIFAAGRMQDQLRYAGLVEVCRIRKLGYPVRRTFDDFYKRFKCCDLLAGNLDKLLASLAAKKVLKDGEWAKGKTRVFMRTLQASQLELAREASLVKVTIVIQKYSRRFLFRRRYKNMLKIIGSVKTAISKREEKDISDAIDMSNELPFGGGHVKVVKEAKALLARIQEEKRVVKLLENAILSQDINSLKSAISTAKGMSPSFNTPLVGQAQELITKLEKEAEARAALKDAISKRDLAKLNQWIPKAQEMNMVANELPQAIALKTRIEQENALLDKLKEATKNEDFDELNKYISECAELGLDGRPEVKAAKDAVDKIASSAEKRAEAERKRKENEAAAAKRKIAMEEAEKKLSELKNSTDSAAISAAIEAAMKLGVQSPELDAAQAQLSEIQKQEETQQQLHAAVQVLQVKSESGMVDGDLEVLNNAINKAATVGGGGSNAELDALRAELAAAREAMALFQKQVEIRGALTIAIATKDKKALAAAISDAENIDFTCAELKQAKEIIREMDSSRRQSTNVTIEEPVKNEPYDVAEEARKRRQDIAKQAKYDIKYYPGLRTPDDFARGAILNKSKIKDGFLIFQNYVIPKSLIDFGNNKDANKLAVQMHKELLGYMGDKQMPFPAMLAQDILQKGYEYKPIRDEIYLQIIKQLAGNPRAESVARGWQMLCMSVGTFPPSYEFENYLLHYILEKRDRGRGAVVDYARYCLRTLEAILSNGDGSGFVPSVEEILAYKDRPPILASIYLVDGNVITEDLPITPDLNVGKVLEMCTGWLDLRDERVSTLGMFAYDLGEINDPKAGDSPFANAPYRDLIRTPRPLRNEDYMGDVIVQKARQRRKFKFVLKKKIFLPQHNQRGSDPLYERLVYLQAEDEAIIQGNISFSDVDTVVELAAISMTVAFGESLGSTASELEESGVMDFISPMIRKTKTASQWAALVAPYRVKLADKETEELQQRFLDIVRKSPDYGTHWFYVHKIEPPPNQMIPMTIRRLPRDLILAFSAEGLSIFDKTRRLLTNYSFADIYRWGGSSSQFSLILADESVPDSFEFTVVTAQAADMAAIILDHVRAIMAEEGGNY